MFCSFIKMLSALILFVAGLSAISAYDSSFFCSNQEKLCNGSPNPHVGCSSNDFDPRCGDGASVAPMNQDMIDMIVGQHNAYRSEIAQGQTNNGYFGTAARMVTMKWDQTLADLAEINAKKCSMHHSECRNTPEFKISGQNTAYIGHPVAFADDKTAIKGLLRDWFEEYKLTDDGMIRSSPDYGGPIVYHFLTIVCDRQTNVGCAMSRYIDESGMKTNYFVCNYAATSITNMPVFTQGKPASRCKTGENPNYPGLCSESESCNPNTLDWDKEGNSGEKNGNKNDKKIGSGSGEDKGKKNNFKGKFRGWGRGGGRGRGW